MTWRNGTEIERLATLTRRHRGEELRVSVNEVTDDRGNRPSRFVSLRIWYTDPATGALRASGRGVTLRRRDLATLIDALGRAHVAFGGAAGALPPTGTP